MYCLSIMSRYIIQNCGVLPRPPLQVKSLNSSYLDAKSLTFLDLRRVSTSVNTGAERITFIKSTGITSGSSKNIAKSNLPKASAKCPYFIIMLTTEDTSATSRGTKLSLKHYIFKSTSTNQFSNNFKIFLK